MPLKTQLDEPPVLNLTSMLDVMFLLVIFFMAGSKFTEMERKIALRVPQVSDANALTPAPEKRVINVYQDGQITLDRQTVSLDELKNRLIAARGQYHGLGVLVRGDATGQFQRVAEVLNACKQAGIAELAISVRTASIRTAKQQR
jgi:biopolymer transport protein ExbD